MTASQPVGETRRAGAGARITDSPAFSHLWGPEEVRAVFDERARLQGWLDVIAALARAQAAAAIVPLEAAEQITRNARVELLDLDAVAEQTRRTGHSTLGLIRVFQQVLPAAARDHVYAHATVQDVTDTWTSLAVRRVGGVLWRDLRALEQRCLDLAVAHRETPMSGRTHGQPGAPITFGFKAAGWADELRRHLDRMRQGADRWLVGQYGGGVGTLTGLGPAGLVVRQRLCADLGLREPTISWLSSRDRVAEIGQVLTLVSGTAARIGEEVYELSRPEIGELREGHPDDVVASITMPHKHNPEISEHLSSLARLTRAAAGVLNEGIVSTHERDGRAWKAEWVALPEACLLATAAVQLAVRMLDGLEVDGAAMAANLGRTAASAAVLAALAARVGPRAAQQSLHDALRAGRARGLGLVAAVAEAGLMTGDEAAALGSRPDLGVAPQLVDAVLARAAAARAEEPEQWP